MKCSKCQYENPDEMSFCIECGNALKARESSISSDNDTEKKDDADSSESGECPVCFSIQEPGSLYCGVCGHKNELISTKKEEEDENASQYNGHHYEIPNTRQIKNAEGDMQRRKRIAIVIHCLLAAVVVAMMFSAAGEITDKGESISIIRSVGGQTMDEEFYLHVGGIYAALATCIRALSIALGAFLVWLGFHHD